MKSRDRQLEISISRDGIAAAPVPHTSRSASHHRETSIARRSASLRKRWRAKQQSLKSSWSFWAHQNQWRLHGTLSNCARKVSISQPPFETESHLVRINRHQIAFLRDKIYWQNVVLPADNHKIRRGTIRVIRELDRHMTGVTEHFVFTFPFAFNFLRHPRVSRRILNLRRSRFL